MEDFKMPSALKEVDSYTSNSTVTTTIEDKMWSAQKRLEKAHRKILNSLNDEGVFTYDQIVLLTDFAQILLGNLSAYMEAKAELEKLEAEQSRKECECTEGE